MKKFIILLFTLLLFGLLLRLNVLNPLKGHQDFDYMINTHMMTNLITNGELSLKYPVYPSSKGWEYLHLPLTHLTARIFQTLTHTPTLIVLETLNSFWIILTALIIGVITGKEFGKNYGILTTIFILFGQNFIFTTLNGQLDIFSVLIFSSIFYIWKYSNPRIKKWLPLLYTLLAVIKYENWIFLFMLTIFQTIKNKKIKQALTPILAPLIIMLFFLITQGNPLWPSTFRANNFQKYNTHFQLLPFQIPSIKTYLNFFNAFMTRLIPFGIAEPYDPIIIIGRMLTFLFRRLNLFLLFLLPIFLIYLSLKKEIFLPALASFITLELTLFLTYYNNPQLINPLIPEISAAIIFIITSHFLIKKSTKTPLLAIFLISFIIPFFTGIKTVLYDRYYLPLLAFFPYITLKILERFRPEWKNLILIPLLIFFITPTTYTEDSFYQAAYDPQGVGKNYPLIGYEEYEISPSFSEIGNWNKENTNNKIVFNNWGYDFFFYLYADLNPKDYLIQRFNIQRPPDLCVFENQCSPQLPVIPEGKNVLEYLCENNYTHIYPAYDIRLNPEYQAGELSKEELEEMMRGENIPLLAEPVVEENKHRWVAGRLYKIECPFTT